MVPQSHLQESTKYNLGISNQILTWSHFRNQERKITLFSEGGGNLKYCCYDRKKKQKKEVSKDPSTQP